MRSPETSGLPKPAPDSGGLRVRTYGGSPEELACLASALRSGELVAIPTETVYGLAAHALDEAACRLIFEVKGRPLIDPLIVHVATRETAAELAEINEIASRLMDAFWPGALTLVLPRRPVVPGIVTAGLDTVALRCPRHPLAQALLRASGLPLAAPSANLFGYVSPTTAQHVIDGLGSRIDHLLDGGPCEIGLESTIVDVSNPLRPTLLRPGAVTTEDLARVLGTAPARPQARVVDDAPAPAPGMLARHYSPQTRLHLFPHGAGPQAMLDRAGEGGRSAFVSFTRPGAPVADDHYWLSEDGSCNSAAHHVFALLRRLDSKGYTSIWMERAPEGGIGDAINDRLTRAAAR